MDSDLQSSQPSRLRLDCFAQDDCLARSRCRRPESDILRNGRVPCDNDVCTGAVVSGISVPPGISAGGARGVARGLPHKATIGWHWITGEPWGYSHWREGEPNNKDEQENRLCLNGDMAWNNLESDQTHGPRQLQVVTYVIEYGKVTLPTPAKKAGRTKPALKGNH